MKRLLILMATAGFLSACSTSVVEPSGDEILSSSDNSSSFPEWAYNEPRFIKGSEILVSGSVEINSDQSPSRGLDAAVLIAKSNLSSEIKERLQSQTQYASEGLEVDPQALDEIVNAESSLESLHGIHLVKRWYAKVKVPSQDAVLVRYRCFALIAMPLDLYKAQVAAALQSKSAEFSQDFKTKVLKSWDRFFESNPSSEAGATSGENQISTEKNFENSSHKSSANPGKESKALASEAQE